MQSVISRLQMLEGKAMSPDRQIKVKKALQKYQEYDDMLLLACHMCYVEAARFKTAKPTNEWLKNPQPILTKYFAKIYKEYKQYVEDYKKELKQKLGYEPDTPAKAMSSKDKNKFDKKVDKLRKSYTLKPAEYKYAKASCERTTRWLKRCKDKMAELNMREDTINKEQLLFGINQGAVYADIRSRRRRN